MCENISVRQWQEQYRAGAYRSKNADIQCSAGWSEWQCQDSALAGRLKRLAPVAMGITAPFILDNYCLRFTNICPMIGPLYDNVHFELLIGKRTEKYFLVTLNSPYERLAKWALTTARYGFTSAEFVCGNAKDMVKYINDMGRELELGLPPAFLAEQEAVAMYAELHGEPSGIFPYREGYHQYSYTSRKDKRLRHILVAHSLEDAPPGFQTEGAVQVNGFYVFCPEDSEKTVAVSQKRAKSPRKKKTKEVER